MSTEYLTTGKIAELFCVKPWQAMRAADSILNEERIRAWQAEREDADHKWRNEQADVERKWRENQAQVEADRYAQERADEHRRHRMDLLVMGGIVTAISAIVQIIAALIAKS
jgi:hypothetical protein